MESGRERKAIGAWERVAVVRGLGGGRVWKLGGDEQGDGEDGETGTGTGTAEVVQAMYGRRVREGYERFVEGFVREWVVRVTGGWWVEVRMVERLSILRKGRMPEVEGDGERNGGNQLVGDW